MDTYQYHNVPEYSAKKPSPYADSDYVTPFDTQQPAWQLPPTPPVMPRKKKRSGGRRFMSALLVIVLVISCCGATAFLVNEHWERKTALADQVMDNKLAVLQEQLDDMKATGVGVAPSDDELLTPGQVYEQNVQAVVAVSCMTSSTDLYGQTTQSESTGSGFLITQDGYVVTNYHVVEGSTSLTVITMDGAEHSAQMVGYESSNDICVLKLQGEGFPCVELGSSDRMAVGDQVVAIGCPLGELTATLTVGYVSAKDRFVTTDGSSQNMLQTDAAINSGNSGGPLFNMLGQVIGITTAKYSGVSSSGATIEGIGFAIPISDVQGMISDLTEYGYINTAYLGVSVRDVPVDAQAYGLPAGAYVADVVQGCAADRAGVKTKDIIVNVGGYEVRSLSELSRALQKLRAGDTTTITVYRSGSEVNLAITLDQKPDEVSQPEPDVTEPDGRSPEDIWGSIFG